MKAAGEGSSGESNELALNAAGLVQGTVFGQVADDGRHAQADESLTADLADDLGLAGLYLFHEVTDDEQKRRRK